MPYNVKVPEIVPLKERGTQSTVRHTATGRRTWKTVRSEGEDNGEVVWPPCIEAALIEALEKYRPVTSNDTKNLNRFPIRNTFISEYIFNVTGKWRNPKQVGSRIQQLKNKCSDVRIKDLLSRRVFPTDIQSSSPFINECSSLVASVLCPTYVTTFPVSSPNSLAPSRHQSAQLELDPSPALASVPTYTHPSQACPISMEASSATNAAGNHSTSIYPHPPLNVPHRKDISVLVSRPHQFPNPTTTITSLSPMFALNHYSLFTVYFDGALIHSESALFSPIQGDYPGQKYIHRVYLIPQYWSILCESTDPSQYTIVQEIVQTKAPILDDIPVRSTYDAIMLTVMYEFNIPPDIRPQCRISSTSVTPTIVNEVALYSTFPDDPLFAVDYSQMRDPSAAADTGHIPSSPKHTFNGSLDVHVPLPWEDFASLRGLDAPQAKNGFHPDADYFGDSFAGAPANDDITQSPCYLESYGEFHPSLPVPVPQPLYSTIVGSWNQHIHHDQCQ